MPIRSVTTGVAVTQVELLIGLRSLNNENVLKQNLRFFRWFHNQIVKTFDPCFVISVM